MAYNNYFPATYQPTYYGNQNPYMYQQIQQQNMMQTQQPQQQSQSQQIQQSGFVLVQSEQEARAYPVAPGNSITFKDETAPFCYVKTMGFNQLDRPIFERYRLVKEDTPSEATESRTGHEKQTSNKSVEYALKSDLGALWDAIEDIKEKIKTVSEKKPVRSKKTADTEENVDEK